MGATPKTFERKAQIAVPAFFIAVGLSFILASAVVAHDSLRLFREGIDVPGTIVRRTWHGPDIQYLVRFQSPDGAPRHLATNGVRSPYGLSVGDRVTVAFLPAQAADTARIKSFSPFWGLPLFFALFGGGFVGLGIVIGRAFKRRRGSLARPR